MLPMPKHWTVEDFDAFPDDGNRYEIIDGELFVTPAPNWAHQGVVGELFVQLANYLKQHPIGRAFVSPADIRFGSDTVVQPDVFVLPSGLGIRDWADVKGRLLLAAEVLSPSTAGRDRTIKRERYLRAGVPEYWIVDPRDRSVERWTPQRAEPELVRGILRWAPPGGVPPLDVDLPTLFEQGLEGLE